MKILKLSDFRRDEGGSITAFLLVMFLIMVVGSGMAVDFMRHESERVVFQDVLDRAVLATASFDSQFSTEAEVELVVRSHLVAAGYDVDYLDDLLIYATVTDAYRRVDVSANFEIRTFFLRIINKPTLTLAARSTAKTSRSLELSLVLDVSGSMGQPPADCGGGCDSKIVLLRESAINFIHALVPVNKEDQISVSIVPFSATVEPGEAIANQFGGLRMWHRYSYCFEFEEADFSTTAMPPLETYTQGQSWWSRNTGSIDFRWCPRSANAITPLSNDRVVLEGAINNLEIEQYTSIWAGAKWGAALLDPSLQPVIEGLTNTIVGGVPVVHPTFVNRPARMDSQTAKYLVIMTDGVNTKHRTIFPESFDHFDDMDNPLIATFETQRNADWWEGYENCVFPPDPTTGISPTIWHGDEIHCDKVNIRNEDRGFYHRDGNLSADAGDAAWKFNNNSDTNNDSSHPENLVFPPDTVTIDTWDNDRNPHRFFGDNRLNAICSAAKNIDPVSQESLEDLPAHPIVIFTIGFDVPAGGGVETMMKKCASHPNNYFPAEDGEALDDAFAAIAAAIAKLKLVVN